MYTYTINTLNGEEIKVLTPFIDDFSQIDKTISHEDGYERILAVYPNGFEIESLVYAEKVILNSNRELIVNGDGTMSVKL